MLQVFEIKSFRYGDMDETVKLHLSSHNGDAMCIEYRRGVSYTETMLFKNHNYKMFKSTLAVRYLTCRGLHLAGLAGNASS